MICLSIFLPLLLLNCNTDPHKLQLLVIPPFGATDLLQTNDFAGKVK